MEIPPDAKTIEMSSSIIWFDEDGVLYSVPKPGPPHEMTMEEAKKEMDKFRELTGHKKLCLILETNNNSRPPRKEERDFVARELESITKAMALVTNSPLSKMVANLFFGLKPPSYPVKMFLNEKDAKEWIRQYL